MCDLNWEDGQPIPNDGIIHVPLDHIVEFFNLIEGTNRRYIVVSSNSDYSIVEQSKELVERDLSKYMHMIDVNGLGYSTLVIPPRCAVEQCRITDKYSVKMYSFTKRTFNRIPPNVIKWFCTNCNIESDTNRIVYIPFGIPEWSANLVEKTRKEKFSIYVNFQFNTVERLNVYKAFNGLPDVICEKDVSHEQYVNRLKECAFCLALPGNGKDTYRILESVYCSCIPVIVNDIWSKAYDEIPCIKVESYYNIYNALKDYWEKIRENPDFFVDTPQCDLVYYADAISRARELL